MKTTHSITYYIDRDKVIEEMMKYHNDKYLQLYNRGNNERTQRARLIYHAEARVHREMKEFWEKVTFEPLEEE